MDGWMDGLGRVAIKNWIGPGDLKGYWEGGLDFLGCLG